MKDKFQEKLSEYKKRSEAKSVKKKQETVVERPKEIPSKEKAEDLPKETTEDAPTSEELETPLSKSIDNMKNASTLSPKHYGGKQKIQIEYVKDKVKRSVTFSKRKGGLLKKAHELAVLTGADVLVLVATNPGKSVYSYASENFKPMLEEKGHQDAIRSCIGWEEIEKN
jgi:hypothetical protein